MTQTHRIYDNFLPSHYDLTLTLEREKRLFNGTVTITGRKPHHNHPIMVHAKDLKILSVTVDDIPVRTAPLAHDVIKIDDDIAAGDHKVTLTFSGLITDPMHGLYPCYYEVDGVKKEVLATQFESHHAREVFPCIDEPEAKATFDLTLITEPGQVTLGNMPVVSSDTVGDTQITTFQKSPHMSTYLLAFVVGELQKTHAKTTRGTEVAIYSTLAQKTSSHQFALNEAIQLLEFYEEYFGIPYPLPKCDHVALPDFSALAMENWGLITYREGYLLANDKTSVDQQHLIATVIAHELAHQWFGNLVTMQWWDDLWLNESFANVMEYIALDNVHPDWHVWEDYMAKESTLALSRDQFADIQPVAYHVRTPDDIATVFDKAILYCKGSRLIRMAIAYIGEDAFRQALKQYFTDFAYANTSGHDLWRAMHAASGKHIEALMGHWLVHSGLPVVSVSLDNSMSSYTVRQHRLSVGGSGDNTLWDIPLQPADPHMPDLLHTAKIADVAATSPQLNVEGVSHFVTHYDESTFAFMLNKLDSGLLSSTERGLLLYETYILTQSGHYKTAQLIELLEHYKNESSSAVWLVIRNTLKYLRLAFDDTVPSSLFDRYGAYLLKDIAQVITQDAMPHNDQSRTTQGITMLLLVQFDHSIRTTCLDQFRQSTDLESVDGDIQPSLFLAAVLEGNDTDYRRLTNLYGSTKDAHLKDMIARALACDTQPSRLSLWIEALNKTDIVKLQDIPFWFYYLMDNPVARDMTWQWLTQHWSWLEENFGNGHALEKFPMHTAKTVHGEEWLRRYKAFFETHDNATTRRAVHVGINEITARTAWVSRDKDAVADLIEARSA